MSAAEWAKSLTAAARRRGLPRTSDCHTRRFATEGASVTFTRICYVLSLFELQIKIKLWLCWVHQTKATRLRVMFHTHTHTHTCTLTWVHTTRSTPAPLLSSSVNFFDSLGQSSEAQFMSGLPSASALRWAPFSSLPTTYPHVSLISHSCVGLFFPLQVTRRRATPLHIINIQDPRRATIVGLIGEVWERRIKYPINSCSHAFEFPWTRLLKHWIE